METNELISVIVPVYNVEPYLKKCIESIINQTYNNLEIILVDDGSFDKSGEICDEYASIDSRIKVIHKENGGLSSARNAGINAASGEYLAFVDSDDWIETDMYELLYKSIKENNTALSCGGRYDVYLNEKKAGLCPHEENKISSKEMILKIFETKECDVSFCDKLFHKSLLESIRFPVGEINEDEAIIFSVVCDLDFVSLVNKPFYNYNHRENSITTSEFNNKKMVVLKNARNTLKITTNKFPDIEIQAKRYFSKKVFALLSMIAFSSKNTRKEFKGAYKELLNEIKTNKKILSRADKLRYLLLKTKTYRLVKSILK